MSTGSDLRREYLNALGHGGFSAIRLLLARGVPRRALAITVPALSRVRITGALFEPDPNGRPAYVLPIRVDDPATPEAIDPDEAIAEGGIVDLIALYEPDRWAMRRGAAEWAGAIPPQYLEPEPVPVWRTPLGWLRSGCCGLALLSPDRLSQYRVLSLLHAIRAEDRAHGTELRNIIACPFYGPQVVVDTGEIRHAA